MRGAPSLLTLIKQSKIINSIYQLTLMIFTINGGVFVLGGGKLAALQDTMELSSSVCRPLGHRVLALHRLLIQTISGDWPKNGSR